MNKNLLITASLSSLLCISSGAYAQSATITALQPSANTLASAVNPTDNIPAPGTVTVRFGGHLNFYAASITDSGDRALGSKQSGTEFGSYIHLSPTVDGVAANGLRYGVYTDFWTEHSGAPGVVNGAGGGSVSSISNDVRYNSTLYIRHGWAYIGLPKLGTLRFGTDGVTTLFQTGTFENFNDGGWNGDVPDMISANAAPIWPFAAVGNQYAPTKITYLSPQVYGFELGASYEPSTSSSDIFDQCNTAGSGCARLASSNVAGDLARRRNTISAEMRYRNTFGAWGVAAEVGYTGSGTVSADTGGLSGSALTSFNAAPRYRGWDIGIGGIAITYGGLTVGGHIQGGNYNGQWGQAPDGSAPALAWLVGTSYTDGPIIVGASFFQYNSAGNSYGFTGAPTPAQAHVGQERDRGVAVGGTYTITAGVSLFLDYLWGDRHENGYDLLNGATTYGTANPTQNNSTRAQLIGFGTQIRW